MINVDLKSLEKDITKELINLDIKSSSKLLKETLVIKIRKEDIIGKEKKAIVKIREILYGLKAMFTDVIVIQTNEEKVEMVEIYIIK